VCARAHVRVCCRVRARACVARQEPALFKEGGRAGRMVTAFHQVNQVNRGTEEPRNRGTEEPRNRGTEEPRNRAEEGVEPGTSALEGRRDSRRARLEVRQVHAGTVSNTHYRNPTLKNVNGPMDILKNIKKMPQHHQMVDTRNIFTPRHFTPHTSRHTPRRHPR
jgi:hypothetical protein